MKLLKFKKFFESSYVATYRPINLRLPGYTLEINTSKIEEKEKVIKSAINQIYPNFNFSKNIMVDGREVRTDILSKCQKNIAILYEFCNISLEEGNPIKTADELISFIDKNKFELFKVGGKYFDRIYSRLEKVSNSGSQKENIANDFIKKYARTKGIDIEILPPTSKEDIGGIDGYFIFKGKKYTIQTKSISKLIENGDHYEIYISGDFTKISTDYLILIPSDKLKFKEKMIFKGANILTMVNESGVNYYQSPKSNLLFRELIS